MVTASARAAHPVARPFSVVFSIALFMGALHRCILMVLKADQHAMFLFLARAKPKADAAGNKQRTERIVLKQVAVSDMFEIQSNKLAQDKGNAAQKSFASQMVTDHTKTSAELKTLVSSGKVKAELPTALDSSHQSKLDKLKDKSGKDFSSDFNSMQVSAHKDAVSLFERYAKGGENADLKNWAGKTLPALQHHLEMAQALEKAK
jgi:putative membrane protein